MTDSVDKNTGEHQQESTASTRRRLLKLGAAAVPAAITLRGGAAWASSITCQIELPSGRVVYGAEIKESNGQNLTNNEMQYLSRLSEGDPGYSCLQSIGYVVETNAQDPEDKKNSGN